MQYPTIKLREYEFVTCISRTEATEIYRGRRTADAADVIMKTPAARQSIGDQIARYRNEYGILQHLDGIPCVPSPLGLEYAEGRPVLIYQGRGGLPLANWLDQAWELPRLARVAREIALALVSIHERRVIHKDIKPHNILLDPETDEVCIIDFGISAAIPEESCEAVPLGRLEGTLAYMSPEQTGRMNRNVDQRSDLYSLGVTLFQLATGTLPFTADTPLDWCYAHLAMVPSPVSTMRPGLPPTLAAIIDKLLTKPAEERYQTAAGLAHDLALCCEAIARGDTSFEMPLGAADFPTLMRVPHDRYGREASIAALTSAFHDTSKDRRPRIARLGGRSGIGKSALAQSLRTSVMGTRGYFLSGKFQQHKTHIPYTAVAQAVTGLLLNELLDAGDAAVARLRERVLSAAGNNGQVILDILPRLEVLIGPQSPVPLVGPTESQARLVTAFGDLMMALLDGNPAVLFLDDVQWSDRASIKLVQELLSRRNLGPLFIVLAYRDDEISDSHPLHAMLAQLEQQGSPSYQFSIEPLGLASVTQLVAETLGEPRERVAELAALVHEKTGGNPFFIRQFLNRIHADGVLRFEPSGGWQWNALDIRRRAYTDNVVEYLLAEFERLPASTDEILFLAACIGSRQVCDRFRCHSFGCE